MHVLFRLVAVFVVVGVIALAVLLFLPPDGAMQHGRTVGEQLQMQEQPSR